jgi:hypothetical protein
MCLHGMLPGRPLPFKTVGNVNMALRFWHFAPFCVSVWIFLRLTEEECKNYVRVTFEFRAEFQVSLWISRPFLLTDFNQTWISLTCFSYIIPRWFWCCLIAYRRKDGAIFRGSPCSCVTPSNSHGGQIAFRFHTTFRIISDYFPVQSLWPRGLRHGSAAVRFLGLRVRIAP